MQNLRVGGLGAVMMAILSAHYSKEFTNWFDYANRTITLLNGCEWESTSNSEWNATKLMVEVAESSANSYSPNTCRSYNSPSLISLSLSIELNLHALSTGSSTVQAFS